MELKIIGGGLAGCEAAWQAAERGIKVKLYEMKPSSFSPAHTNENLCELVCSNSLKGNGLDNACGLLKEEMRRMGSVVIACADETKVPAGGALAVDRDGFSALVTEKIKAHRRSPFNKSPLFHLYVKECSVSYSGKKPDNIQILTSDDVSEYLIDVRYLCNGADEGT